MRRTRQGSSARGRTPRRDAGSESLTLDPEAVRCWRMRRGFTQDSLARQRVRLDGELHSISCTQVRRIEADGHCGPTSARTLAALLDVTIAELSPRDPRQLPCGLPREASTDFVGRQRELGAILARLQSPDPTRAATSVEGPAGVGKTELALRVCALCERERSPRILWLGAENPDLTRAWTDVVAPHLGIDAAPPARRAALAVRAIEALTEPVMIVLDGLSEWGPSAPRPRPRGAHIRWLVTSRRRDLGDRAFQHITLPFLDPSSSRALMSRLAGPRISEQPGFDELMAELGGYAIAVELAGACFRRFPELRPRECLAALRGRGGDDPICQIADRTAYRHTLEQALTLVWRGLGAQIRRSWQLAACFAQRPASPALSDACGLSRALRADLRDHHLIDQDPDGSWVMHPLVRAFGRRAGRARERTDARQAWLAGCRHIQKSGAGNEKVRSASPVGARGRHDPR